MAIKDLLGDMDDDDDDDVNVVDLESLPRRPGNNGEARGKYHKSTDAMALDVVAGVPLRWFVLVMNVPIKQVKAAVIGIKPTKIAPGGTKYYAPKDVMPRLVKPSVPIEEYLRNVDPDDLPEKLRETYWNVQKKSQQVRQIAGELWKTTDVIEVMGEVFKHIKNTIMLWGDTVESETELSDEQRSILLKLGDDLQKDIFRTVVGRSKKTNTGSQLKEIDNDEVEDDVRI